MHVMQNESTHPGGHLHWKGLWGCAAVMTPFFQASQRSLAYQFTLSELLVWPPFSIFRKFVHFQPCFGQNSSSISPNFCSQDPLFKENLLPRPYILKPSWHTSTKKKVECPPRGTHKMVASGKRLMTSIGPASSNVGLEPFWKIMKKIDMQIWSSFGLGPSFMRNVGIGPSSKSLYTASNGNAHALSGYFFPKGLV